MATLGEQGAWRLIAFFSILITLLILETLMPQRKTARNSKERLLTNGLLTIFNSFVMGLAARAVVPIAAVAAAVYVDSKGWGLFNLLELAPTIELIASLVLLDLAIYGQHVAAHYVPMLWQFHKVHHSDIEFDVTTALRFHPIEIFISMLWKIVLVFLLGPSVAAVTLFEIILNGCAMFNHANIKWPFWVDRVIRWFIATPDMHRIHHSIIPRELNSNYGFSISLWDRLFGTYRWQPEKGHTEMKIGLENHQDSAPTKFLWSLKYPFTKG